MALRNSSGAPPCIAASSSLATIPIAIPVIPITGPPLQPLAAASEMINEFRAAPNRLAVMLMVPSAWRRAGSWFAT